MKVTIFYPDSRYSGWSAGPGITGTLRRMGHTVLAAKVPQGSGEVGQEQFDRLKAELPTLEELKSQDLLIVSGPEHLTPWLDAVYGKYEWKELGVPSASWFHESFSRDDYTIDFDQVKWWGTEHFFPAIQDAEFHDQEMFAKEHSHWLPFGVDTGVFFPVTPEMVSKLRLNEGDHTKCWPIGFIGLLYEKRRAFLTALSKYEHPAIRIGTVTVEDLSGYRAEDSARMLADNYRRIGVFFNLPALSRLLVSKVYEVMACGTFCLTPLLPVDRGTNRNQAIFENGHHLVYYRSSNLAALGTILKEWSSEERLEERERIALEGCREVREKHSLEKRLEVIFEKCGVREPVQ